MGKENSVQNRSPYIPIQNLVKYTNINNHDSSAAFWNVPSPLFPGLCTPICQPLLIVSPSSVSDVFHIHRSLIEEVLGNSRFLTSRVSLLMWYSLTCAWGFLLDLSFYGYMMMTDDSGAFWWIWSNWCTSFIVLLGVQLWLRTAVLWCTFQGLGLMINLSHGRRVADQSFPWA